MEKLDPKSIENILALTPLQEGMLFHYLQDPQSGLYFEQLCLEISGEIDAPHFEKAWNVVSETNEMLRTVFRWEKLEKPSQIILKEHKCNVIFYDLSAKECSQKKTTLAEIKEKDRRESFDLHQVPFRVILCKLEEKKYEVVISNHHILYDGWSNGVILKEFFKAYHELRRGGRSLKLPVKPPFKEFIRWIHNRDRNKQEQFWREYLAGVEMPTELPIKRRIDETTRAEDSSIILEEDIKGKLDVFVKNNRFTLAPVFYTAWGILLQKYCGSDDVIFGTTVSGRSGGIKGIEEMVGLFINTIPLRTQTSPNEKIIDVVFQTDQVLREREEFENTPLVDIQNYSPVENNGSLFDTIVAIENYPLDNRLIPEGCLLSVDSYSMVEMTHYDLSVGIMPFNEIEIKFSCKPGLFEIETIENLARHFKGIIQNIVENPETALSQLEIISSEEKNRILYDFNNTTAEYPRDKTVHQLFEEQVEKSPDRIALSVGQVRLVRPVCLSYRQLNEQSDRLAGLLIEKGVLADNIVGIMMERSIEMVIGIFGILKAGGAYLPIEPSYPQERIDYMLKDSAAKIMIGKAEFVFSSFFPASPLPRFLASDSSNLAYIIYTSGSTGNPKGVIVEHASVVNLLFALQDRYPFTPADTYLFKTSYIFDVSVTELFGWYMGGGKVTILEKGGEKDAQAILDSIERNGVSHINFVPPMFNGFLEHVTEKNKNRLSSLKYIFLAGEALLPWQVDKFRVLNTHIQLENIYGPTEGTVYSSKYSLSEWQGNGSIPIGRPMPNIKLYIFDKYNRLQPPGIVGELTIAGLGLARGYLNRPELSAGKFKFNRSYKSYRTYIFYKTGDLARWLDDGNIEFLGRVDHQVKIRGFRVELGEIENLLLKHGRVKDTTVVVKGDETGDKTLAAYFVSDIELSDTELREYLLKVLPDYMIPSYFVPLEKIPLTPSGKIDRKALPKPGLKVGESYTAPRNEIERKLVEIWSEVLGRDALHSSQLQTSIGIADNFFRLGGHSLKATILVSRLHKVFDVIVPLAEIFKTPRIKELAEYIKGKSKEFHISIEPAEEKEYYELSPAQKRLYILQQLVTDNTSYNMPYTIPPGESIEKSKLESVLKKLLERHESLRTSFITVNEEPFQRIHREVDFSIGYYEVKEETGVDSLISGFIKPFNLGEAPLLRANLVVVGSCRRVLFIDMHHIIMDGTSQGILEQEFRALLEGAALQPLRLQYKDYSEWNNSTRRQEEINRQEPYWLKNFSAEIPALNLPTDYPRPLIQGVEGNVVSFSLTGEETVNVKRIASGNDSTLYMYLLAVFNILLSKLSGQEDIVIGTPIAARRHADLQNVIGMLVNTLAIRNYPSGDKPFGEFLKEVKQRTLDVYENQDYPFEVLVDKITVNRDTGRNPVFDVMFNLLNQADYKGDTLGQNEPDSYLHIKGTSKFDMNLTAVESGERLFFTLEYSTRLFKPERIERIIGYYKNILKVLSRDTGLKIAGIEIMDQKEKEEVLRLSRGVEWSYEGLETIHGLFAEQVERTPDRIALVGAALSVGLVNLSYRELNGQANRSAYRLREKGVGPDCAVGLMVERSVEMIIGMLGIMKAGGAYLPIDSEYPGERKRYMLEDGEVRWLLVSDDIEDIDDEIINQLEVIDLGREEIYRRRNADLEYIGGGSNLVYVIYTSGSTGKPKGVMVEHRNLVNLFKFQFKYTGIDCSRILQFSTISFDASFHEIFSVFLSGGQLFLVNKETRTDIPELFKLIERNGIKTVFLPISFLKVIFKEEEYIKRLPRSIRHIQTAGDQVIISNNFRNYLRERKVYLHNHYGPSETHVVTTLTIDPEGDITEFPSIGKPVINTGIYIVDKWGNLLPPGVVGELRIGSVQVGRGYLNRPELTAEKFARSYRTYKTYINYKTGDLARLLSDGNIEFLGRIDHQVKIRGFRVEPGEIESRLLNYPGIKEVVVLVREEDSGDKYICAYIVSDREYAISELRESLSKELPDYMIPSYFVHMEKIPLTVNGKIDRKALPKPGLKAGESYTAPRNEIERKLVGLWSEILGKDALHASQLQISMGIDDNFFELGGHSLKATILVSRIEKAFNVKILLTEIFKSPRIRELAGYITDAVRWKYEYIELVEKKEYYVLSSAQKRLYFLQQMDKDGTAYNISSAWILEGIINTPGLEQSIRELTRRHESLRTSIEVIEEEPVQRIHAHVEFEIEILGGREQGLGVSRGDPMWSPHMIRNFIRPFDLSSAPLLRVGLVKLEEEKHIFLVDMHHIISDGMSTQVLVKDFSALYAGKGLPEIKLQYKDYAEWQNRERVSKKILDQGVYWKKEYEGEIPVLELPTDKTRPPVQSFEGDTVNFEISGEARDALKAFALASGTTLYMALLALYNIFLAKISSQEDIVIGSPVAGRRHADLEKIIGMFVNTLALRNFPSGEKGFMDFLREVKEVALKGFENQEYQYEDLVEQIPVNRDVGRNPLFDAMFALQNTGSQEIEIPGLKLVPYEYENKTSKFDLTLTAVEAEGKLLLTFEYSTKLFKRETVERFIVYFKNIVRGIVENKNRRISELEILTEEEKNRILIEFNDTTREYPKDKTIHQLFEEQEEKSPDRIAISIGPVSLSYRRLNQQSDRLAGFLIEKGVLADNIVGIMMERSIEMVIGIFGILKAGGAYLPIEPSYPQERIDYMLKDSAAKILLTAMEIVFNFHHSSFIIHHSGNLAYIIYTSGSTGKPKGVMIDHGPVVNLLFAMQDQYPFTPADTYLLKTSYVFDVSVTELFGWYMGGSSVAVLEKDGHKDPRAIVDSIERNRITHINFVPSMFNAFIEYLSGENKPRLANLKYIFLAGEALLPGLVEKFRDLNTGITLENIYGPTESTVYSSKYPLSGWNGIGSIPIGKPMPNIKLYILNNYHGLQPVGVAGELCIRGPGLARGYLNRPELTAEKFKFNRSYKSSRTYIIYKTGDLVRWLDDGNIEFLGRIDHQVKIRGFRIELGEIENQLLTHEKVKEAIVITCESGGSDKYLCAYIVIKGKETSTIEPLEFREYLAARLPDYMIPSYFVQLDQIPLTSSGKVNRKALPGPESNRVSADYVPPHNEIETKLVEIWSTLLGIEKEKIGINDNFFELGGHSLKATALMPKIHKEFDIKIDLGEIFKNSTISGLARLIERSNKNKYTKIEAAEKKEYYPLSSAQKRLYFLQLMEETGVGYNMPQVMKLEGKIDHEKLEDTFVKLIQRHESFRTSFFMVDEEPVQRIHDRAAFEIDKSFAELFQKRLPEEWRPPEAPPGEGTLLRFIRPFDLSKAPLLRVALAKIEEEFILMVDMHHIISDGVSMEILIDDFTRFYQDKSLIPLNIQYKEYAAWQDKRLKEEILQAQEKYWLDQLQGFVFTKLPIDYLDSHDRVKGSIRRREIGSGLYHKIERFCNEHHVTKFIFLITVFEMALARNIDQWDITLGIPSSTRDHPDLKDLIGIFLNIILIRTIIDYKGAFLNHLSKNKNIVSEALNNQDYPYEMLKDKIRANSHSKNNELFSILFNYSPLDIDKKRATPDFEIKPMETPGISPKYDMTLYVSDGKERIMLTMVYKSNIYSEDSIGNLLADFLETIQRVLEDGNISISRLTTWEEHGADDMEADREIETYYNEGEFLTNRPGDSLTLKISEWALRCPGKTAIKSEGQCVSYRELENTSNQVANFFQQKFLETPHVIIILERSAALIQSIIGLLKCGLVFVPVDPLLPVNRVKKMVEASRAEWVITNNTYDEKFKDILDSDKGGTGSAGLNVLLIDPDHPGAGQWKNRFYLDPGIERTGLTFERVFNEHCYIYFTSGSTGTPKGILGRQKGLIHFIQWEKNEFGVDEHFNVSQMTPPSFDVFLRDIFLPLMTGGTCCIPSNHTLMNMKQLIRWIDDNEITLIHTVPSLFKQLVSEIEEPHCFQRLKYILLAGELLRGGDIQHFIRLFKQRIGLVNIYGPTETTLAKLFYRIQPGDENRAVIPVGKPIDGVQVLILDTIMQKCRRGKKGEICIRTPFRSAGYYNHLELTESVFIKNPYGQHPDDLIYKTGDLGRRLDDGNIEVSGRMDFQVKIRGVRIEPGEIENRLLTHPGIRDAVVMAWDDQSGDKYLCAYVIPASGQHLHPADLNRYLSNELPDTMIPSYFVQMERFPLTPSGKIDRNVLPEPVIEAEENFIVPANEIEKKLLKIWSEVLRKDENKISVQANFFELGGHSLKVAALASKIHKEFNTNVPLTEFFKTMTIRGLSQYIQGTEKEQHLDIGLTEKKWFYSLSSAQKRLYFLQMMEGSSSAYNLPRVMKLKGRIEVEKLANVFGRLIQRHESLRTSFLMVEEEPVQRVHDHVAFEIDKSFAEFFQKRLPEGPPEAPPGGGTLLRFIRPFDLSRAPLLRVALVKIEEGVFLLMVDMHHIISDGTSMGVLVKEFMTLYEGRELPQPRHHYKDYAQWETHRQDEITGQESYWLREFSEFEGEIPVLDLPFDYVRPRVKSFAGSALSFDLDGNDTRALNTLALQRGVTFYMVLLAVYNLFLAKLSNQEVVVVGTPTAGRRHADLEQVIGMFVNTLALKNAPALEKSFHSFLEEVKENTINAFANQDYQYEDLVEKVMQNRDAGRNPLFDTMFVLQNLDIPTIEIPGLKLEPYPYEQTTAKFDLTLICVEIDEHLSCTLEYSTQLFKQETIRRFLNYLKKIIVAVPRDPGQQLSKIDMLPEDEKKQLVIIFNDTVKAYPENKTIYRLFEDQVDRIPDHAALVFNDQAVTFRNFDEWANRLANYLRSEKRVQPGDRVVVLMDRSIELIIVLMGVMKARAAYVPMDASLPVERLRFVFNDASIGVVVSQQKYFPRIAGVQAECRILHSILCMEDLQKEIDGYPAARPLAGDPGDPAYVMYTSGSSGIPKGVLVEHRTIVNTITWRKNNYEYAPGHVSLQVPPYFFDSSVTDIFTPLLGGARLALIRDEERSDLAVLKKIIAIQGVSHFIVTPVFYNVMLEEIAADLKHIKMICCAGDNFPDELIKKHFDRLPHVRIFNEYGPTENSVNSTAYELKPHSPRALIGKPIDNVAVYVLDRNQCLAPIGVTGELCLAGSSLAVGYLNRPELTVEKFNRCYRSYESYRTYIIYKSGDLARWLPDGNLEFSGRVDNQVKIRGIRVETGEIENRLMKRDDIKEAVVQVRRDESGANYLCAYITPHSQVQFSVEPAGLKEYLSQWLPGYMIPSYFIVLEKLPLTPNGKLDINALPGPQTGSAEEYTGPRNDIEKKLVEIWEAVLGKNNIGINDNFFYIGGDSIKSIQIMSRMNGAGYKLEMKDIFQYPVISELAPHVKKLQRIADQAVVTGIIPLTPIQSAFFNASASLIDSHHYNQAVMLYAPAGFDKEAVQKVFIKIQEHHDALRMTYKIDAETGEVLQVNHGVDYPLSFRECDLKGRGNNLAELNEKINRIQGDIDLEKGPLMKLGLFHLDDGDRLLIVIHHLVIDGVSWRILLEDIAALYEQILAGEKMVLPRKTDSFKHWSEKLQDYAQHKTLLKEKSYWDHLETEIVPPIKKDFQAAENAVKDTRDISVNLDEAETALLLNKVNRCYKTEIDDILLTALGLAIRKTFGYDRVLISLEGHGRENISQEIDIGRTVGWFTTEYPVFMDVSYADNDNPGRQIKEIKETLRKIPNKGIGYGILKYLTRDASGRAMDFKLKPQIIFNYLGQFDAKVGRVGQTSLFQMAKEPTGHSQSLNRRREYELGINGMTVNNRLSMAFSYNQTHFKHETIAALSGNFQSELKYIIAFCSAKENSERTPSDFTYRELTIERLGKLLDVYPDVEDIYTLSPMQEGMLFHSLVDNSSYSYFEQTAFRLQGELDIPLVEKTLNELVKRHHVLRTAFVHKDTKRPVQVVLKDRPVDFYYRDIGHIADGGEKENLAREFKANDKKRSFDLNSDIPVRASILRLDKSAYEFIWSFHHILMDGWCIGILISEFFQVYTAYVQGSPYRLPVLKPYRTYIQWLEKQDQEESGQYWENYLDSFAEQTGILKPKIKKDANQPGYSNRKISFELNSDHTKMLTNLAARHNATLNTLTQTTWGILLGKYTGKEDVVFGAVVSGRPFALEGVESMVGLFINTIPVRIHFHAKMKFSTLLQKIQADALGGEAYHYHPLADIQSRCPLKQNLMDHLLVFENYPIAEQIEGYGRERNKNAESSLTFKLTDVDVFEQTNYDLNVILSGTERLRITLQYNGHTVDDDYVKQIARHYRAAFDQVMENRELEVGELTLLSEEEKNRLLYEFNDTEAVYPADKTIHRLFEEQVERTPDHIALVGAADSVRKVGPVGHVSLSYRQLNEQSGRLAGLLIEKGVLADDIVGIMMERSIDLIIGILGILKAGCPYVPINPGNPSERIDFMLKDSGAKIMIGRAEFVFSCFSLASALPRFLASNSSNLAYVIYTSGSTGMPRGVPVTHANISPLLHWGYKHLDIGASDRTIQNLAYYFDWSVWEIFITLTSGAVLYMVSDELALNPGDSIPFMKENDITVLHVTPTQHLHFIGGGHKLETLKYLFLGAEKLTVDLLKRSFASVREDCRVFNMYGPTEATIISAVLEIKRGDESRYETLGSVPIGGPVANGPLLVLDKYLNLCPVNITGELYIAGDGVAAGYLNNPELTAEKFKFNRSYKSYRTYIFYKTGDLARWLDDGPPAGGAAKGIIEFLGRIDQQVKIRGFRIELAEIENRLKEHPLVKEAVVIDRKDNERQYLCAYIVAGQPLEKGMVPVHQLKEYLEEKLPSYMIPACFVEIDKIPLNANGKIDRHMLRQPLEKDFHSSDEYLAPVTDIQRAIAAIWQEVLGRERIGIQDNFFDLGGDSLDFVKVANKLREKLDKEIPVATLFTYATISSLERYITGAELPGASAAVPGNFVMLNGSPLAERNIFFVHEILGDVGAYMEFSKQLGAHYNCWGVEAEKLRNYVPRNESIEEISARYISQMKQIQPQGPYNLITWSWGGHLGLEMALQLEKMGETLSFLGFVDCSGPDCKTGIRFEEFTLESEKNFLTTLFKAAGKSVGLDKIDDLERLWTTAVDFLSADPAMVVQLRQLLILNALALPDYHNLSGEELVQFLNLNRTHANASAHYIPVGKIHTPIHYFAANQNPGRVESWKDYCHKPVIYHEINGDHHSIFRNIVQIAEFAGLFREVISRSLK